MQARKNDIENLGGYYYCRPGVTWAIIVASQLQKGVHYFDSEAEALSWAQKAPRDSWKV